MGNTPAHHKRRLSGDGDCRMSGTTPPYVNLTIPPSKRRNMHSLTVSAFHDLSRSAPSEYPDDSQNLDTDMNAVEEATSMLRAASLRDSINEQQNYEDIMNALGVDSVGYETGKKHRPVSAGFPSDEERGCKRSHPMSISRPRASTSPMNANRPEVVEPMNRKLPTVFRWNGGGRDIYISGTFNNWEKRIPMVKRNSGVYVIIDCKPGTHEYKYFIDGAWYHDPTKPTVDNGYGTKNNVVHVRSSDFDVLHALEEDQASSRNRANHSDLGDMDSLGHSPPGEYGRVIPPHPSESQRRDYRSSMPVAPGVGTTTQPPTLPPHLLQGILNMDTSVQCDPNLLPPPNHVIVNHLYALSIKDGVIVLSVITRFRQKFVSTVFYKPIES